MTQTEKTFLPGNLVSVRNRTWVVQNGSTNDWLQLRAFSGAEDESIELDPTLEKVDLAQFPEPDPANNGSFDGARHFYNALRFQLRSGAGPFRSFGAIAVEPRSYQLVPLLMAMQMETVRLLIADDVGVGKTIEAALIIREMVDRGEISSFAVLCPPHLVEQWLDELKNRFHLNCKPLTSATASKLERKVPHGKNLVQEFPYLVVSLDYIKSENNREFFQQIAPELIIVDEAHSCTRNEGQRHLRYELLKRLSEKKDRHLLFLTATPHSGDQDSFYNLLGLLNNKFRDLRATDLQKNDRQKITKELSEHFIQRLRKDIAEWQASVEDRLPNFPNKLQTEFTYKLNDEWNSFFDEVLEYCRGLFESVEKKGKEKKRRSLVWYVILGLLRCVSSSPQAALTAIENRLKRISGSDEDIEIADELEEVDSQDESEEISDKEPVLTVDDSTELERLKGTVQELIGTNNDPKYDRLVKHLKNLLKEGFDPIVFCRYISTAEYVANRLSADFKEYSVEYVTGSLVPEERENRVEELGEKPKRILVATDCLSEGINLQEHFNAVVHYDLVWNPTRHAQREGRVDRFGQSRAEVKCSLLYGEDNPVDGFILNVILKKSEKIQKELGVLVPVPENSTKINEALIKATLFKAREKGSQMDLPLQKTAGEEKSQDEIADEIWKDALEKAKKATTRYAHRNVKTDEIVPLWNKEQEILGSHSDLEKFTKTVSAALGAPLEQTKSKEVWSVPERGFQDASLKLRLEDEDIKSGSLINFENLHRGSPLISILSEEVVNQAIEQRNPKFSRCAVAVTDKVSKLTRIFLLRIRYQLFLSRSKKQDIQQESEPRQVCLLAEEIVPIVQEGRQGELKEDLKAGLFMSEIQSANISRESARERLQESLELFEKEKAGKVATIVQARAQALLSDHRKVARADGKVARIEVCKPIELLGLYVLLPDED